MTIVPVNDTIVYKTAENWNASAPAVVSYFPSSLVTDVNEGHPRLRVDVAQTGFFVGREFRTFRRLSIGAGASLVVKAVVPVNIILFSLSLDLVDGWVDVETRVGGTPGGTFSETLPIFRRNTMTTAPVVVSQTVLTAGGTHTGGTVLDVLAARAAGATAQASSVGAAITNERGIAPNTYHFVLTNPGSGTALGVWSAWWEERP